jgi:hypothetical protein
MAKFVRVKLAPGFSEGMVEEEEYYLNTDLITLIAQSPQNQNISSVRLAGSELVIHINESAETFIKRTSGR